MVKSKKDMLYKTDYPFWFWPEKKSFYWVIMFETPDLIVREERLAGKYWSYIRAERVSCVLNKHFRNGVDIGKEIGKEMSISRKQE